MYDVNLRRAFPGGAADVGWVAAKPLIELIAAAIEPITLAMAAQLLGWSEDDRTIALDSTGLLFPVRDGRFQVMHKTILDYMTGEVDASSSVTACSKVFQVNRPDGHARLAAGFEVWLVEGLEATKETDEALADAFWLKHGVGNTRTNPCRHLRRFPTPYVLFCPSFLGKNAQPSSPSTYPPSPPNLPSVRSTPPCLAAIPPPSALLPSQPASSSRLSSFAVQVLHLCRGGRVALAIEAYATDLRLLRRRADAKLLATMARDYAALAAAGADLKAPTQMRRFVGKYRPMLEKEGGKAVAQLAWQEPEVSVVFQAAETKLERVGLVTWRNKPTHTDPCVATLEHKSAVGALAVSATRIVGGSGSSLFVYDAKTEELLEELVGTSEVKSVAICEGGEVAESRIVAGYEDGSVKVWGALRAQLSVKLPLRTNYSALTSTYKILLYLECILLY